MNKQISKSKVFLAIISLIITLFIWQQGLKDSLQRPSVSFDISQKETEIIELALPSIPENLRNIITSNPSNDMRDFLSEVSFNELTERNKLIWIILNKESNLNSKFFNNFDKQEYKNISTILRKVYEDKSYVPEKDLLEDLKQDKYLYFILARKFNFETENMISKRISNVMLFKLITIRLIPLLTIFLGSIFLLKSFWQVFRKKRIDWKEFQPLDLNLLDMVLLISGGFVVLGEVISPLISITLVESFSKNLPQEISQALKIFFGYLFMALPPLFIIYKQIKSTYKDFNFKNDYFQFNWRPILDSFREGIKGWIMIIPFVLLTSLIMNFFINNNVGSNPLLEIVLNNNNYLAFIILFITTTVLAPFFEEIIFRGVLLPILSREFGIWIGILMSSFVFALAHLSFSELPPLFILGIGLAFTRLKSGRLFSSIIMHSLWNGLTFLNLYLLRT